MAGADRPCRTPEIVESVILDQVGQLDGCRLLIVIPPQGSAMGTATFGPVPVVQFTRAVKSTTTSGRSSVVLVRSAITRRRAPSYVA